MTKNSLKDIEKAIWNAGELERSLLPPSEYKKYILPILALKRLSDLGADERQGISLPELAKWKTIMNSSFENIGETLMKAFHAIENENPEFRGVFSHADFNSERLGDAYGRNTIWKSIIDVFSQISLKNEDLENPSDLREVIHIIEQFDTRFKIAMYPYTPPQVEKLMINLLSPKRDMTVYDPFCNYGTTLIESINYADRHALKINASHLYGQVINVETYTICKLNLLLNGFQDAHIEIGDVIRNPKFFAEKGDRELELKQFDRILGVCPWGMGDWGVEFAETDPYNRFRYGIPPRTKSEFAYLSHMIASLKKDGVLADVVPHGVLFRMGKSEGKIREIMLARDDIIEAVIGLPEKLFSQTSIPTAIIIVNKNKPENRKGYVLFIDASKDFQKGRTQNVLLDEHIQKIVDSFKKFKDQDGYCSVVPIGKISDNNFSLEISQYIPVSLSEKKEEHIDIGDALKQLNNIHELKSEVVNKMRNYLEELKNVGG
jgi:type I restriction enzyme M protein